MARQTDDRIEHTERRWMDNDIAATAIHRLSERVIELEGTNAALVNALTRYRTDHDQQRCAADRPCPCEMCQQAEKAINAAKGGE